MHFAWPPCHSFHAIIFYPISCFFLFNRWGFVTQGCIDGYSRLITFLKCTLDNKSETVLQHFIQACLQYGTPSKVRSDHGTENIKVALFINLVRGRKSHITGRSVHNQRIERLWRDVRTNVIEDFRTKFYAMEDDPQINLDPDNEKHIYALQYVFLPVINQRIEEFRQAWNNHKLRSEQQKTPKQLWLSGTLDNSGNVYTAPRELVSGDVNLEQSLENGLRKFGLSLDDVDNQRDTEVIQERNFVLTDEQNRQIAQSVDGIDDCQAKFKCVLEKLIEFGDF